MKFKLLVADFDTALFRAAKSVQEDYIEVTHTESGHVKEFENKTAFYGHWRNKNGGWLASTNEERLSKSLSVFSVEDFSIEELCRYPSDITDPLGDAERSFDFTVGRLKKSVDAADYKLVIGGEGNFRYESAQQLPYKGNRAGKPLIFHELKELVIKKYGKRVVVVDGREADDWCSAIGFQNYKHYLKTGKWDVCLAFIDKDLKMIVSPSFNYDDDKPEVVINTPFEAAKCYAVQLLCGDKGTDNIPGLPNFTDGVREKYELKKTVGIGSGSALKYLEGVTEIPELFQRVVEAYKSYYGTRKKNFTTHRGDVVKWGWRDYLQDNGNLLYMHRREDCVYDIFKDTLLPLGVKL